MIHHPWFSSGGNWDAHIPIRRYMLKRSGWVLWSIIHLFHVRGLICPDCYTQLYACMPAYTAYRPIVICRSGRPESWITDLAEAYPAFTAYRHIVSCPSGRREWWITDLAEAYTAYTAYRPIVSCPSGRPEWWIADLAAERAHNDHDDHTHWSHDDLTELGPIRRDSNAIIPNPWFSPQSLIGTIRTIRTILSSSFYLSYNYFCF